MDDTSSVHSARSTGRYRSVGRNSTVDESLFLKRGDRSRSAGKSVVANMVPKNAGIITRAELEDIKKHAVLRTNEDEERDLKNREGEQERKRAAAKLRKQRMMEKEIQGKKKAEKSDIDRALEEEAQAVRDLAAVQHNEEMDGVKLLKTLGARATAFTIRDRQLEDKKFREKAEREYNQRQDLIMEIDRLRDLKKREVLEQRKVDKRLDDREVLMQQIHGRRREAMKREEAVEQEKVAMMAQIRRNQQEDEEQQKRKASSIRHGREEVLRANEKAVQMRALMAQREAQEDLKILEYQKLKAKEAEDREAEEERRKQEAELRTAKLRAMQEKSQNKQAELDELRARRAAEEKERRARHEELEINNKQRNDMFLMAEARQIQAEHKRAALAREAMRQRQEYAEIGARALALTKQELNAAEDQHRERMAHRDHILDQIKAKETQGVRGRAAKMEEGRKLREEFAAELTTLQMIREQHVGDLERAGVNPRYLSEMKLADMRKLQMR